MISVLIPIYNYNVVSIIRELENQLKSIKVDFEIICIDDNSTLFLEENKSIFETDYLKFIFLSQNIGRSKIRNLLASKAKFDWLLFLDADVMPVKFNFIENYVKCIKSNQTNCLFVGGVNYLEEKPASEYVLRWKFGRTREQKSFLYRKNHSNTCFLSSNFAVSRSDFLKCGFDKEITKYGYEDLVFVNKMISQGVEIIQVDNPVYHLGIDKSSNYLDKVKESLFNLNELRNKKLLSGENSKLLKYYELISKFRMGWVFRSFYNVFKNLLELNLKSEYPSLVLFDIYKISLFCFIANQNASKI